MNLEKPQNCYLVSDGKNYTNEEFGSAIRRITGRPTLKWKIPLAPARATVFLLEKIYAVAGRMPFLHSEKLKEVTALNWSCDSGETWQELGILPDYTLETGLLETAGWYKENGWLK
jgi:nucleoside-diphosphate-sugar epimerase